MELRHDTLDGMHLAAVIERDQLVALYAQPNDERPWLGDYYVAQVTRYAPAQRAYFIDIGEKDEAFLPHAEAALLAPGQKIMVRVERPATMDKKIRCSLIDMGDATAIGRVGLGPNVLGMAQRDYPSAQLVLAGMEDYDNVILDLLEPKVNVQDGIDIVIESVTALTAIDVNNADPKLQPLEVNRLVTRSIAQQLRLRNIGGQVVVDFLRLRDPKHRASLESAIQQAVTLDPNPVQLYGFTRLGLFELTRTKRGLPLETVYALSNGA